MKNVVRALALPVLLILPSSILAQVPDDIERDGRPIVEASRLTESIEVDGRLDEAAWARAAIVDRFTQVDPEEGQPVSERTEARVLFDEQALYIGVRLHDREPISSRLGRRDMGLADADWLGVVIDSYHDHRTAFSFDVNPSGVQRDAVKSMGPGGNEIDDLSWDPVWEASTTVDDGGWTAEYRIPFSQLRFSDTDDPVWGIQIERVIGRRREYAVLSFVPKAERGGIPTYGHLTGLGSIEAGDRLEVSPYVLTRAEFVDPGANPYRTDSEYFASGGVDLTYRLTSDFTLTSTLNPDFGQVEVDPAVINLSVYETFFQEKRPFFVEGSEIFDFGRNTSGGRLFYSRRVGRRPQVAPPTSAADVPEATTILGAAKLSGKTASGWSVGIMEALTDEESARYTDSGGATTNWTAEPLTNYFAGRVRRDAREGRSSFGAMVTTVNRALEIGTAAERLHRGAYAGGIDFRHEFSGRTWVLQGSVVGSRVSGEPAALVRTQRLGNHFFQRPDAEHLEVDSTAVSMSGYSVGASLGKQAGRHWRGNLAVAATAPQFEVNDLGFQTRTDRRDAALNMTYLETQPGSFWRNYAIAGAVRYEHNYANQRIQSFWMINGNFTHLDFWNMNLMVRLQNRALDDRATRGGPLIERPQNWIANGSFRSDGRKPVTVGMGFGGGQDVYGGWNTRVNTSIGFKASPRWSLTVSPSFTRSYSLAQYVGTVVDPSATDTYGARYLFAPLEQTTLAMETRLDLTFTPKLSFQLYAPDVHAEALIPTVRTALHCQWRFRAGGATHTTAELRLRGMGRRRSESGLQSSFLTRHRSSPLGVAGRVDALSRLAAGARGLCAGHGRLRLRPGQPGPLLGRTRQRLRAQGELLADAVIRSPATT